MSNQPRGLAVYKRIIPANEVSKLDVYGNFIRIKDASQPFNVTVRSNQLNGGGGVEFTMEMKKFEKWFSSMEYDEIIIENPTAENFTVEIMLGFGDYQAEILSRTLAAPSFNSSHVADGPLESIDPFLEVPIVQENPQRKRILFGLMEWSAASGDVAAYFGPPDIGTVGEIEELAFMNTLDTGQRELETTAAMSLYLVPASAVDVSYAIHFVEELYSAS